MLNIKPRAFLMLGKPVQLKYIPSPGCISYAGLSTNGYFY